MKLLFIFGCCGLMMIFNAIFKRDVSELTNLYVVCANHYFYDMANTWKIDLHYLFNLFKVKKMQHDISDNCYYCGYGPQHRSPVWSTGHLGVCTITHADDPPENAKNKDKWRKFKMLPRNFGSGGGQIITLSTRAISKEMSLPNKAIPPLPPMPRVNPLHPHKPTQSASRVVQNCPQYAIGAVTSPIPSFSSSWP